MHNTVEVEWLLLKRSWEGALQGPSPLPLGISEAPLGALGLPRNLCENHCSRGSFDFHVVEGLPGHPGLWCCRYIRYCTEHITTLPNASGLWNPKQY